MMQRAESAFWTSQNSSYVRPVDVAVRKISSFEAVGFVRGVRSVFNVIEAADPDIIFLPERGAGPIDWALQRFGEIYRGKERFKVFLPIGTCVDPFTCAEWGPGKRDKSEIVGKIVGNLRETRDWLSKPLLIDEVQSGATITKVTHDLVRALIGLYSGGSVQPITDKLQVVAVQDNRNGWLAQKKAKGYTSIVDNSKAYIQGFITEMPLFTVDRQIFLNYLLAPKDSTRKQVVLPMVMQNTEAQEFIRNLVTVVTDPMRMDDYADELLQKDRYSEMMLHERVDDGSIIAWYRQLAKAASSA